MAISEHLQRISDTLWELPPRYKDGMRVPARIYATDKLLAGMDETVLQQISNVACLPGITEAALCMPDGHFGYGFPIGGVAAMDVDQGGVISPGGIGFDIDCGMRLVRTNLTHDEVRPYLHRLREVFSEVLGRSPEDLGMHMVYELTDEVAVADAEFRAWGQDLPEVFAAAAEATINVMLRDLDGLEARECRRIELENADADMLLFDLLQELIYYKDAEGLLLRVPQVRISRADGGYRLTATAVGEAIDPQRHDLGVDVKAVTLHRYRLEQSDDGWSVYAILDI